MVESGWGELTVGNEAGERGRGQHLKVCFCISKEFCYLVNRDMQKSVLVISKVIGSVLCF